MIILGDQLNYEEKSHFNFLMDKVVQALDGQDLTEDDLSPKGFEKVAYETIIRVQEGNISEKFSQWPVNLVSGSYFPDITLNLEGQRKFGVEVKTSKQSSWKTIGGSINEGTRIPGVERIKILFARTNPFEVRHGNFEDCISDVAVTHSPRYLIDFEMPPENSIFKRIGIKYEEVWQSESPFNLFREYFQQKAQQRGTDLWFVSQNDVNPDELPKITIEFFNALPQERKDNLYFRSILLFPEIFGGRADYNKIAIWLLRRGVLNTSLRDTYSSGRQTMLFGYRVPSKYHRLHEALTDLIGIAGDPKYSSELEEVYGSQSREIILRKWASRVERCTPEPHRPCVRRILKNLP